MNPVLKNGEKNICPWGGGDKELHTRQFLMKTLFKKFIDPKSINKLLDFGGSKGEFISDYFTNAKKYLFDLDNYEPIDKDIKKISSDELDKYDWDFIQCCHTLEHVSSPMEIINRLISFMKTGSYLYIELPYESNIINKNIGKEKVFIHEHINFFSVETLKYCFSRPDFIILENKVINQCNLFGQSQCIQCLVKKVEPSDSVIITNVILNHLRHDNAVLRENCNKELKTGFIRKIFSIEKTNTHKIFKILGIKLKFKLK